jgi:hypothetical protein
MPDMNAKRIEKLEFELKATDQNMFLAWNEIKKLRIEIAAIKEILHRKRAK